MTRYQLYSRLVHLFAARHYRGHGIHSPALYNVVRQVFMKCDSIHLKDQLAILYPDACITEGESVQILEDHGDITIISCPFASKQEYEQWKKWRIANAGQSVWLPGALVIFHDSKLQNQHFIIRT